jgi:hypothetical protein
MKHVGRNSSNVIQLIIPIALCIALGWFFHGLFSGGQNNRGISSIPGDNDPDNSLVSMPTSTYNTYDEEDPIETLLPTVTRTPTITGNSIFASTPTVVKIPTLRNIIKFTYSFYNPSLGGNNCLTWDSVQNNCVSKMSSGHDYWKYYDIAVACPPEYPTGTIIRVLTPAVIAHDWICLDKGGLIEGDRLDFLQRSQVLPWNTIIDAVVIYPCDSCR